jgi:hypothetical protein
MTPVEATKTLKFDEKTPEKKKRGRKPKPKTTKKGTEVPNTVVPVKTTEKTPSPLHTSPYSVGSPKKTNEMDVPKDTEKPAKKIRKPRKKKRVLLLQEKKRGCCCSKIEEDEGTKRLSFESG